MNIFEEALTGLSVEVTFDENNMFSCELNNDENEEDNPLLLSFYRDDESHEFAGFCGNETQYS